MQCRQLPAGITPQLREPASPQQTGLLPERQLCVCQSPQEVRNYPDSLLGMTAKEEMRRRWVPIRSFFGP